MAETKQSVIDGRYAAVAKPPDNALRKIEFGNLKGKSDINPQWKIEVMTKQYGMCGIGWKFEIVSKDTQQCPSGEILLFMAINLYIKDGGKWSEPIPGYGGDFIVKKNKNGLVPNDEAFKMCLTDALGNAFKCIGVAANVYRGFTDTKYGAPQNTYSQEPAHQDAQRTYSKAEKSEPYKAPRITPAQFKDLEQRAKDAGVSLAQIVKKYGVAQGRELTELNWSQAMNSLDKLIDQNARKQVAGA